MEKRTILAVIFSAMILVAYQVYVAKHFPQVSEQPPADTTAHTVQEAAVLEVPAQEIIPEEDVTVETEKYVVTLSNIGGCVKTIALKEFNQKGREPLYTLVNADSNKYAIFNVTRLGDYDISQKNFRIEQKAGEIIYTASPANGLLMSKRFVFNDSSDTMELELLIKNETGGDMELSYAIIAGSSVETANKLDRRYTQVVSDIGGKIRRDNGRRGRDIFIPGAVKYAGIQNKYFSVITKPSALTSGAVIQQIDDVNLLTKLEIEKFILKNGSASSHGFLLYAGQSDSQLLARYGLSSAVSYGFFGGISAVILSGLRFFYRVFRNWGVAIILLSAVVNLVLFPLSRKSYESMKKLQDIQPHMDKLRNDHKDNPQKLNKEMMELYKKYNVNPLGGCLPLLLQMPIFIALYQALMRSIELRGAGFLWIRDLSMPDAVRLPTTLPLIGNSINILPILMTIGMFIQQKSSIRPTADKMQAMQQKQMMIIMPLLFLLIMYNFPSGLVLYWLVNTLLTMFEQRAIMASK